MGVWWWKLFVAALAGILFSTQHCASQKGNCSSCFALFWPFTDWSYLIRLLI